MTQIQLIDQFCEFRGKCTTDDVVALNFAYEMLMKSQWISVEDELPQRFVLDPNDSVFVLTYGLHTKVAFYKYDKGEWVGNTEVTHWMPLPPPPALSNSSNTGNNGNN